jgi:crotonobetainyl-CoA:carnitine CoA-transferase CaiB-like acyl-CoA transferase
VGALDGIRVIDFGHYIAGPLAAVMLADQGADVIHVDPPDGPKWKSEADAFLQRGKRRISLDLKTARDRDVACRLLDSADVVIENFRPGVMDRLGLGAQSATQRNSQLIYCSIPGFAPDDPRASMQAWEGVLDAATDNCIPRAGEETPGWDWSRPFYSAVTLASNFGAFLGATGTVMALIARQRTGFGQRVEVPIFDAMFTLIGHSGAYLKERGLCPPRGIHGRGAGAFKCKDGKYVQFDTSSARHLVWFAREAGITDWGPDMLDVVRLRDETANQQLHARLRELFLTRTAAEWEEIGNRAGAAMGWARNTDEWIGTDHARAIGAVVQLNDPELGPTWMAGLPVHLTATPGAPQGPRHLPDADHDQVISELEVLSRTDDSPRGEGGDGSSGRAVRGGTVTASGTDGRETTIGSPLEGMKVIDLCVALAGPTCGRLLYEFGADVVKINAPKAGVGGYLNRGKRSLLLNVESFEAQRVFWGLAEQADVVLENFSPGTADRLGIGYHEVKARNPDIVYASVSSYGQFGPWKHGRGWERQGQAVAGIMERQEPPAILGPYNLIDIGTGVLATFATGLGLYHRLRTGEGQHVQGSLCQTATYHQTPYMLSYAGRTAPDEPRGYTALGTGPLDRFYQGADGKWFFLSLPAVDADKLRTVQGLTADNLEVKFKQEPAGVWVERLQQHGIPAQMRVPVAELMVDPYVVRRGLSVSQAVDGVGETTAPGLPVRLSHTPMRLGAVTGQPGSDAADILAELGLQEELPKLERAWVLQANDLPSAW